MLRIMSSPSSSTSCVGESMNITKSATLQASMQARRSLLSTTYCIFCLKRSTSVRRIPSSGTSVSISKLPLSCLTAEAASPSLQSGTTATIRGAPSRPANTLVSRKCSLCFVCSFCRAWFRRSNFDMSCWCGDFRCPLKSCILPTTNKLSS